MEKEDAQHKINTALLLEKMPLTIVYVLVVNAKAKDETDQENGNVLLLVLFGSSPFLCSSTRHSGKNCACCFSQEFWQFTIELAAEKAKNCVVNKLISGLLFHWCNCRRTFCILRFASPKGLFHLSEIYKNNLNKLTTAFALPFAEHLALPNIYRC